MRLLGSRGCSREDGQVYGTACRTGIYMRSHPRFDKGGVNGKRSGRLDHHSTPHSRFPLPNCPNNNSDSEITSRPGLLSKYQGATYHISNLFPPCPQTAKPFVGSRYSSNFGSFGMHSKPLRFCKHPRIVNYKLCEFCISRVLEAHM